MFLKKLIASTFAVGILAIGSSAQAASYHFGHLLSGGGPSNIHFADLEINDLGSGHWSFFLHNIDLSAFGSGAFIGSMAVDGVTPSSVTTVAGGGVSTVSKNPGGGPGGSFDFRYDFGRGSDKLKTGESVSWNAFGLGSSHLPISGELALHVQGTKFSPDSAWYVSPVPEPETYAMLLAGLGLIGFSARSRKLTA
ncbi:FxDxF family PEP-CTERM protein [Nitrosomonas oligotropha]|uniref:PEP-CTERM protein-sorting domain-containing protein n=1 Tax=Nitrosomonas oligotropha TaxID=42354 RepID=A0A1H8QIE4_9PROT|nr:FxDxF family PEP-CTERM protein [Nitrosomonas oligotropha]SDX53526.1 PEP-CTERM protein-sorting domain-containing protein [Nitrosomonas oligotropha]SEO53989.1 PEP-CTERM protein-sorting domain-containing protein [Nitrosomonas oligotropha]